MIAHASGIAASNSSSLSEVKSLSDTSTLQETEAHDGTTPYLKTTDATALNTWLPCLTYKCMSPVLRLWDSLQASIYSLFLLPLLLHPLLLHNPPSEVLSLQPLELTLTSGEVLHGLVHCREEQTRKSAGRPTQNRRTCSLPLATRFLKATFFFLA